MSRERPLSVAPAPRASAGRLWALAWCVSLGGCGAAAPARADSSADLTTEDKDKGDGGSEDNVPVPRETWKERCLRQEEEIKELEHRIHELEGLLREKDKQLRQYTRMVEENIKKAS